MIRERQREKYETDGYVVIQDVIDVATLNELRRVTDDLVGQARDTTEHTSTLDLDPSHTPEKPLVRRIKHPYFAHPFYQSIAAHPPLMAVLSELIGDDIRLRTGGKVNLKLAGDGAAVEWHQDWAFYPHTNQDVLAVGMLLDDMGPDNGPLLVLPGSHKGPIYNHHSQGLFCGAIDVKREGLDVSGARELHATAGSITVHHARLVHGSAVNRSTRARRILFYVYAACDAWPLMGINDLDEFDEMIMHGEATLNARMEDVPVRMPLPAASNQGSIYENQRTLENKYFLA
ncbi:MAG: phytanoyl-CoA dioxygenase family protein [Gammaproteobacteria bacterium]|nr:phytanoyl-CoA dioxygenase family protein [Gammaproteobacteria bacterium]